MCKYSINRWILLKAWVWELVNYLRIVASFYLYEYILIVQNRVSQCIRVNTILLLFNKSRGSANLSFVTDFRVTQRDLVFIVDCQDTTYVWFFTIREIPQVFYLMLQIEKYIYLIKGKIRLLLPYWQHT